MTETHNQHLPWIALVMGVLAILLGPLFGLIGIVTGHMARSRAENFPHQYTGGGKALVGLILSYLSIMLSIIFIFMLVKMHGDGSLLPMLQSIDPSGGLYQQAIDAGLKSEN